MILSAITLWNEDYVPTAYQTVLTFWAVMLVCALVNIFGTRWLDLINKMCLYWTSTSVVIIMVKFLWSLEGQFRLKNIAFLDHPACYGEGQKECRVRFWVFRCFCERMVSHFHRARCGLLIGLTRADYGSRPSGWSFFVGLLQAAYTLTGQYSPLPILCRRSFVVTNTGYGMVAAMCEEVQHPEREVPKAMVLSVAAAGVTGVVFCRRSLELYFGPD